MANALSNIVVELRNSFGSVIRYIKTSSNGSFTFTALPLDTYYIDVVAGHNQVAAPTQKEVMPGSTTDFFLRGVMASLIAKSVPTTLVVITTLSYSGAQPPPSHSSFAAYSGVTELNGQIDIPVPSGTYQFVCWVPQRIDGKTIYKRVPAAGSTVVPGGVLQPQTTGATITCGTP